MRLKKDNKLKPRPLSRKLWLQAINVLKFAGKVESHWRTFLHNIKLFSERAVFVFWGRRKILRKFLILVLIFAWVFSGWPQIWHNPQIPPKVQEAQAATTPAFEAGEVTISDSLNWTSITLDGTYTSAPVIIATPVTNVNCGGSCSGNSAGQGGMYPIPIVKNVTTSGFDISMCVDGGSTACSTGMSAETFHWFAFDVDDAGNYNWIEAGTTANVNVSGGNTAETFSTSFAAAPVVWTQAQTYLQSGNIGAHAWVNDTITTGGFTYIGCTHQGTGDSCTGGTNETFGYVAINTASEAFDEGSNFQSGMADISNSDWTAATFSPTYTNPRVMVTQNDDDGGQDPEYAWAQSVTGSGMNFRYCEEDAGTVCNTHTGEKTYWFAVEEPLVGVPNAPTLHDVPFDNEKTGDSTPDFEFTGSDPNGTADIIYQIQIDDDYAFGSMLVNCESDAACLAGAGSFTNTITGGDTSPFNEGERIRFTPTTAMTTGTTYYWRVRAEDDSASGGTGSYGDWSSIQSVTFVSGTSPSGWLQTTDEQFDTGTLTSTQTSGSDNVQLPQSYTNPAFETGQVTVSDSLSWTNITLIGSYASAPVIFVTPATAANCESAGTCAGNNSTGGKYPTPLVKNVSTTSFDISMCVDGGGSQACATGVSSETFDWFAFDVDDDDSLSWIEVDTVSGVAVDGSGTGVTYSTSFTNTPAVWLQAQTYSQSVNLGAHGWANPVSSTGFTLNGCVHDAASIDVCYTSGSSETFGYIAIDTANQAFQGGVGFQSGFSAIDDSLWTAASFSPEFTSPRVMVTQNSETGTQKPHYPWARDVITSGMDFRYCEQDNGTTCNTHNAENTYWFAVEQSSDASSGTIMSPEIDFDWVAGQDTWGDAAFSTTETNGDVKLKVYYTVSTACDTIVPDGVLNGNSSGFDVSASPIDISGLTPVASTYNKICLQATLTDSGGTPFLNDWTVTWATSAGTLSVDIVDSGGSSVSSPTMAMAAAILSFAFQSIDGTFGVSSEKIRVSNTTSNPQWTLTMTTDSGPAAFWDSAGTDYDFNDPTAGAGDGGDADSLGGQMTVDASGGTITPQGGCSNTDLSLGSSNAFNEGTTDTITLLTAGASAGTSCYWDLTGVDISQTIPAEQPVASDYSVDMTLTVTAI